MMPWIALLTIALALGAIAAVISSRRVRSLRDELFEEALPSARTGERPSHPAPADPEATRPSDREDWGLRWVEVTNLTPTGPERRPESTTRPSENVEESTVES